MLTYAENHIQPTSKKGQPGTSNSRGALAEMLYLVSFPLSVLPAFLFPLSSYFVLVLLLLFMLRTDGYSFLLLFYEFLSPVHTACNPRCIGYAYHPHIMGKLFPCYYPLFFLISHWILWNYRPRPLTNLHFPNTTNNNNINESEMWQRMVIGLKHI